MMIQKGKNRVVSNKSIRSNSVRGLRNRRRITASETGKPSWWRTPDTDDIIDILVENDFEPSAGWNGYNVQYNENEPYLDRNMDLRFGCTVNLERGDAYFWWDPAGTLYELDGTYRVRNAHDASRLAEIVYGYDEYNITDLLDEALPMIGAQRVGDGMFEYTDRGDTAYIDLGSFSGRIEYEDGDSEDFDNLYDLFDAAGIIR